MSLPTGTLKPGTLPTAQYPVGLGSFPCLERVEKGLPFSKSRFLLSQEPGRSTLTQDEEYVRTGQETEPPDAKSRILSLF